MCPNLPWQEKIIQLNKLTVHKVLKVKGFYYDPNAFYVQFVSLEDPENYYVLNCVKEIPHRELIWKIKSNS